MAPRHHNIRRTRSSYHVSSAGPYLFHRFPARWGILLVAPKPHSVWTMPSDSSSASIKGGATAANAADEAELARMGYKQELKCVMVSVLCVSISLTATRRRDLGVLQVRWVFCARERWPNPSIELRGLLLNYQCHYWYTVFVPLWPGELLSRMAMVPSMTW